MALGKPHANPNPEAWRPYSPFALARRWSRSMNKYKLSTFSRAHGVLRKNFKLEFTLGSCLKQRMLMRSPQAFPAVTVSQFGDDFFERHAVQRLTPLAGGVGHGD